MPRLKPKQHKPNWHEKLDAVLCGLCPEYDDWLRQELLKREVQHGPKIRLRRYQTTRS